MLEMRSTRLLETEFARPAKGNEKGSAERKVRTLRSSLLSPVPKAASWEELNDMLVRRATERKAESERFAQESSHFLPLADYKPCRLVSAKADKLSLVRFEGVDYSVPTKFVSREVLVRGTPFEVCLLFGSEILATHPRSYAKGDVKTKLEHYLDALELKPRVVRTAAPVIQAGLPDEFEAYRRRGERDGAAGDRRFVALLRMLPEFGVSRVASALSRCNALGIAEPADIRLKLIRDSEAPAAGLCTPWTSRQGESLQTRRSSGLRCRIMHACWPGAYCETCAEGPTRRPPEMAPPSERRQRLGKDFHRRVDGITRICSGFALRK